MDAVLPAWPGWETEGLIGRGGFGAVYQIKRDVFGDVERAALKVIRIPRDQSEIEEMRSEGLDQQSITDTFKDNLKGIVAEYSTMRKLVGCANIIHCDDVRYVQHEDGIGWDIYIKMELLTPLVKALPPAPAPIPVETVLRIGIDICRALEICQVYGIVHRDIKPQNIFLSPNGDYKLGDFGVAKTMERTMRATMVGTLKYMAPEVSGARPYHSCADIYSLGMVLYWMLNLRRHPFMPLPPAKITADIEEGAHIRRMRGEPLPAPVSGGETVQKIVLKACAYDPANRYGTAAQLRQDLENALKDRAWEPAGTKPATASELSEELSGKWKKSGKADRQAICPQCGARNLTGSTACKYCKTPIPR